MDAAQAEFTGVTRGTLVGDKLHLIANTQRGKYTPLGRLADGVKLDPIRIWASDLTKPLAPPSSPMTVGGR